MINTNFQIQKTNPIARRNALFFAVQKDNFAFGSSSIDKKILVQRNIISKDKDINEFFDEISNRVAKDNSVFFSSYLKNGDIALSSSILNGTLYSAIGLELDENTDYTSVLDKYVSDGIGVGVNFSNFNNPIDAVKQINSAYKMKQNNYFRPPAFIALLNINHDKILDFITLKDDANYDDWCFDLSVVVDDEFIKKLENNDARAKKTYDTLLNSMKLKGEPGIIFSNDKNYVCDCCASAKLNKDEVLKCASINLSNMQKNGKIDYLKLAKCTDILSKTSLEGLSIGVFGYGDLLKSLNLEYGSDVANEILDKCLKIIKDTLDRRKIAFAITPTTTPSIMLKTTNGIEENKNDIVPVDAKLKTLKTAYKYISEIGQISTTISIQKPTKEDIDHIFKYASKNNIKCFSIFPTV